MLVNRKLIFGVIAFVVLINALGMFEPLLRNDDPVLYATIAKHMVLNNNYIDLVSGNAPWLDKPHFPFWLTSLSFKIFGINSFGYILPGFLFNLVGGYYTFKLARHIYNYETGLIAGLIYITSLHLMISTIDVRAEAYLMGEIVPASYYWLLYDRETKFKYLLLGSSFSAMALMTKGLFVLITIFSGLLICLIYTKNFRKLISFKWFFGLILCFIFISPELISLYLQFDANLGELIFDKTRVSGILWYFWGSQFGRFFNSGPITHTNGNIFFFVHTFLWAFLPWSIIFILGQIKAIREFKLLNLANRAKLVYLLASFWPTFILFSATKFQLDHYTNIIMPYAAILCANYLVNNGAPYRLFKLQWWLSLALCSLSIFVILYLFGLSKFSWFIIFPLTIILIIFKWRLGSYLELGATISSLAITVIMAMILWINQFAYAPYDIGYNLAKFLNNLKPYPVYDLAHDSLPLEFNLKPPYYREDLDMIKPKSSYYIVTFARSKLSLANSRLIKSFCGNTIDKILPYFNDKNNLNKHLICYEVYFVKN